LRKKERDGRRGVIGARLAARRCESMPARRSASAPVADPKGSAPNRSHVDLSVDDVDEGVAAIISIGGGLKKPPSLYPRPGAFAGWQPVIDWAVMQDPFGNEFCLVSELTDTETAAAEEAGRANPDRSDEE
jgi:hypothetical protein